jgi:hypothetical protein
MATFSVKIFDGNVVFMIYKVGLTKKITWRKHTYCSMFDLFLAGGKKTKTLSRDRFLAFFGAKLNAPTNAIFGGIGCKNRQK